MSAEVVVDCELVQVLTKKFGYLEKRFTYLEEKYRKQNDMIEKLQEELQEIKSSQVSGICTNKDNSKESSRNCKPNSGSVKIKSTDRSGDLCASKMRQGISRGSKIIDKKSSQKTRLQLGKRCSKTEKSPEPEIVFCSVKVNEEDLAKAKISRDQESKERPKTKLHTCFICFKAFSNLSSHIMTHTGEKPYSCSICSRKFTQSSQLKVHQSKHHENPKKKYDCPECKKLFLKKVALNRHMKSHKIGIDNK